MKTKFTSFSFLVKIALLSSLLLIGKFTGKSAYQSENVSNSKMVLSDTSSYKTVYQQLIFREVALKIKD